MKRFLLSLALLLGLLAPASAQTTNTGAFTPSPGVSVAYLSRATYASAFFGLVPAGTTPTDVICIAGSATKTVRLQSIKLSGSGTAISVPVTLLRRATADTGGTAATTTANPGITTQISKRDPANATATAVLISYTANPTINDTAPTYIDSAQLGVVATTVGVINPVTEFNFGRDTENFLQPPALYGVAQQICVNFNSTTSVLLLTGTVVWTEE